MTCPRCDGSGRCVECGGSGKITCPTCSGKGQLTTPRGNAYACKTCGGSCQIECATTCSSCEGTGEITANLQKKMREKYSVRWSNTSPLSRVSNWLLGINVLVFLITYLAPAPISTTAFSYLANPADSLAKLQLWRFVTPMFVHANWPHLMFNCWFLAANCPPLEGLYGSRRFLALYLFSGLCGNILSWALNCYWGPYNYAGVGASGALFGVAAAYIALHLRWRYFSTEVVRNWALYMGGYLVLGFVAGDFLSVDNWGHLGGFIGGFLFAWLMKRPMGR